MQLRKDVKPAHPPSLVWEDEQNLVVDGVRFFVTSDLDELHAVQSSSYRFLLAKDRPLLEQYITIAGQEQVGKVFEMGIFKGGSIVFHDRVFKPKKLAAIDRLNPEYCAQSSEALSKYIADSEKSSTLKTYYGVSQEDPSAMEKVLSSEFPDRDIDLIIDDASHLYEETRRALNICLPYLRAGGHYAIEDWGWAHWEGAPWQTECPFGDSKALSNLLIELFMLAASRPDIIEDIRLNRSLLIAKRGQGELPSSGFDIADHYFLRGKAFEAWL